MHCTDKKELIRYPLSKDVEKPRLPCECRGEATPFISVVKELTSTGFGKTGSLIMVCATCQAVWAMETHWKQEKEKEVA